MTDFAIFPETGRAELLVLIRATQRATMSALEKAISGRYESGFEVEYRRMHLNLEVL